MQSYPPYVYCQPNDGTLWVCIGSYKERESFNSLPPEKSCTTRDLEEYDLPSLLCLIRISKKVVLVMEIIYEISHL